MADASTPADDKVQVGLSAGLLSFAVLLGGGQGGLGDTFVQLVALLLLAYLMAGSPSARQRIRGLPLRAWMPLSLLLVPLLQMLPIIPSARQTLGPERALWCLLPGLALYISALTLNARQQRRLLGLVLVLALLALVVGLMQVAAGQDSALYFYGNTNRGSAVGFFANRNHLAALLLMALPLSLAAAAFALSMRGGSRPFGFLPIVAATGLAVLLILGLALTRSRAGLLLGMLALLLSTPMLFSLRRHHGVKRVFALIVALSLVLTVQFALYGILQRLQSDPLGDQRWQIAATTIEAARLHSPAGSGLGTFRQVFQALDTKAPGSAIVNHAHNDYLELWLEAGWPFVALSSVFVGFILWAGFGAWRSSDSRHSLAARAVSISLLLMLLHSALDYPLRTTGNQVVFALLLAILLSWKWTKET